MNKLFIKASCELERDKKLALIKTMSLIHSRFTEEFSNFEQIPYMVSIIQNANDPVMRDLVIRFLKQVCVALRKK